MTNESFTLLSNEEKNRKLKNVLLEKSDKRLTEEETRIIMIHISLNKQYVIMNYSEPMSFLAALAASDSYESQTILGSALAGVPDISMTMFDDSNAAAVITKTNRDGNPLYCVHVYIPSSRTERRSEI